MNYTDVDAVADDHNDLDEDLTLYYNTHVTNLIMLLIPLCLTLNLIFHY